MSSSARSELLDRKEKSMAHLGHLVELLRMRMYESLVMLSRLRLVILEGQRVAVIHGSVCRPILCADLRRAWQ